MTGVDAPLPAAAARRGLYLLTVSRWFPIGLAIGVIVLFGVERGLTVAQVTMVGSVQGFTVLALELPTGGLADVLGRRPILIVAALVQSAGAVVLLLAHSLWAFGVALLLMGIFRALDSGPLEAWFVDATHRADPDAAIDGPLSRAGLILGLSIAAGALASSGLVLWHPFPDRLTALEAPISVWTLLTFLHVVLVVVVMKEPDRPRATGSAVRAALREAPTVVAGGLRLLGRARVLRALVLVEVFWAAAMVGFESLTPLRLSELLGSETRAGIWMGPAAAAAWALFAVGSEVAGRTARRLGMARVAIAARVLNGLGVVAMGLVLGPVAFVVAYLVTYALHGANSPAHTVLLHREASAANRTTILSMNSMVASAAYAVLLLFIGPLAERASITVAMVAAGLFSVLGALAYLPALRNERG